jgi:hypothetical protein
MTNKDQLDQTSEGHQVLALMAEHFTEEQFQPALTLIEQRYTEDLTVWDAGLNHDSKLPFNRTTAAGRLLVFFASPDHVAKIKDELEQREVEHAIKMAEVPAVKAPAAARPKAKNQATKRAIGSARKARGRKVGATKTVKKKPLRRARSNPPIKRAKQKNLSAKAKKSPTKKKGKASKSKRR